MYATVWGAAAAAARHANALKRQSQETEEQLKNRLERSEYKRLRAQAKRAAAAPAAAAPALGAPGGAALSSPLISRGGFPPPPAGHGLAGLLSTQHSPHGNVVPEPHCRHESAQRSRCC